MRETNQTPRVYVIRNQAVKLCHRTFPIGGGGSGGRGADFFLGVDTRGESLLPVINGAKNFSFSSVKFRI